MNDLLNIENKILIIRGQQVMLDRDLAGLYGVETRIINQAVKRNFERFPEPFFFQLTKDEAEIYLNSLRSQSVILKIGSENQRGKHLKFLPYAFTEQGVAMLSAVLHSETAIKVSIDIMNAFVAMRKYILANSQVFTRLDRIETKQIESDQKFETLFSLMDKYKIEDRQGIFFQGQIYDAYSFFQKLIQKAQKEIILIDNYIDLSVLDRLSKKQSNIRVIIYTRSDTPVTKLDVEKFNKQYPTLEIKHTTAMHDRFLILDNAEIYHIGASIKDLGKKCFAFTRLEESQDIIQDIFNRL